MINTYISMTDSELRDAILQDIEEHHSRLHEDDYHGIHGNTVVEVLKAAGYTDLGWMNDFNSPIRNMKNEIVNGKEVYSNLSGSFCIFIDNYRRFYCVDMGD